VKLGEMIERVLAYEPKPRRKAQVRTGVFVYRALPLALGLPTVLASGVIMLVAAFSSWVRGPQPLFRAFLFLWGLWALLYVVRRITGPWRLEVRGDEVWAFFWPSGSRTWKVANLKVRPAGIASAWEGSTVVVTVQDNRVAFRVFRDLAGMAAFCEVIKRGAA
jgi:hypothetical protein